MMTQQRMRVYEQEWNGTSQAALQDLHRIDLLNLFRMPWSMSDNACSWLEATRDCDLDCPYCYQVRDPRSHKTLQEFEADVQGLVRLRTTDAVIVAGGEPLLIPTL